MNPALSATKVTVKPSAKLASVTAHPAALMVREVIPLIAIPLLSLSASIWSNRLPAGRKEVPSDDIPNSIPLAFRSLAPVVLETVIVIVTVSVETSPNPPINVSMSWLLARPDALLFPEVLPGMLAFGAATVVSTRAPVVPVKEFELRLKLLVTTFELLVEASKMVAAFALRSEKTAPIAGNTSLFMCLCVLVVGIYFFGVFLRIL